MNNRNEKPKTEQKTHTQYWRKILNAIIFDRSYWHSHANIHRIMRLYTQALTPIQQSTTIFGFLLACFAFFSVRPCTIFFSLFLPPYLQFNMLSVALYHCMFMVCVNLETILPPLLLTFYFYYVKKRQFEDQTVLLLWNWMVNQFAIEKLSKCIEIYHNRNNYNNNCK